jgi:hypothetical protein
MKKVSEFKAVDESGNIYTVNVFQHYINVGDLKNSNAVIPGLKELRLATGGHVNMISDTEFEIVQTGTRIKKI